MQAVWGESGDHEREDEGGTIMGALTNILQKTMKEIEVILLECERGSVSRARGHELMSDFVRLGLDEAYKIGTEVYVVRPERRSGCDRRVRGRGGD